MYSSSVNSGPSPLHSFLRHQYSAPAIRTTTTTTNRNTEDDVLVSQRFRNPFHGFDDFVNNDHDHDHDGANPLPLDSYHSDLSDIRDAVDLALAQLSADEESLLDLDDADEFFSDDASYDCHAQRQQQLSDDYHQILNRSEESIEFAPLSGPVGDGRQLPSAMSIAIEGMEVLNSCSTSDFPDYNKNINTSMRRMSESGHGSFASLGSLTDAFSKLNHCMHQTAQTREMIQRLSSSQNDLLGSLSNHSATSLASRSTTGRRVTKMSKRGLNKMRMDLTSSRGSSSLSHGAGGTSTSTLHKTTAPVKAKLKSSSSHSLRSIGKRRSSQTHLRNAMNKSWNSSSTIGSTCASVADPNPLVTGIAPINWDDI
jgi:hypothetical protein